MKRTLVVVAAVVGFAAAASASTLNVFTTDASNVVTSTFTVGDTILLKVTGDAQGGANPGYAQAEAIWDGSLTTTVIDPITCNGSSLPGGPCTSAAQGSWYTNKGQMSLGSDGSALLINQTDPATGTQVDTSFITLVADAVGVSNVSWGGSYLVFFDISITNPNIQAHSFTIVPEPTTAVLIGLGLFGLALGGRRRA